MSNKKTNGGTAQKPPPPPEPQAPKVDPFEGVQTLKGSGPFEGMEVGFAMLTPEIADAFPEETLFQRKPSKRTWTRYSRLQVDGKWLFYPAEFSLDKENNILNGGHRKLAVGHSRVPIPIILLKGLEHSAVHAIDRPRPRTLAGNLEWDGKLAPFVLAKMLQFVKSFNADHSLTDFNYDVQDYYELLAAEPAMEAIAPSWTLKPNVPKVPAGLFAALEYLIKRDANEDVHDFLVDCARGEALIEGDPAYAWREFVANLSLKRNLATNAKIGYGLLYVWDKFRRGKQVTKLRVPSSCPDIEPLTPEEKAEIEKAQQAAAATAV